MSRLLSVSVSDELADEIESLAQDSGRTRSEVVRDALRRQVRLERLLDLQRFGRDRAEAAGVGPEDVEAVVDEVRARRR